VLAPPPPPPSPRLRFHCRLHRHHRHYHYRIRLLCTSGASASSPAPAEDERVLQEVALGQRQRRLPVFAGTFCVSYFYFFISMLPLFYYPAGSATETSSFA